MTQTYRYVERYDRTDLGFVSPPIEGTRLAWMLADLVGRSVSVNENERTVAVFQGETIYPQVRASGLLVPVAA